MDLLQSLELNNNGSPKIGLNTSTTLSLRDERVGASYNVASGSEIGVARIYDYVLRARWLYSNRSNPKYMGSKSL